MITSTSWSRIIISPQVRAGTGVTDKAIARPEQALGIAFPESLRVYLRTLGWVSIGTDTLYGLGRRVPRGYGLVDHVRAERRTGNRLPLRLLPIMNDGVASSYCVDARSGRVVFWDHERGPRQRVRAEAPTLLAWIKQRMREAEVAVARDKQFIESRRFAKLLERLADNDWSPDVLVRRQRQQVAAALIELASRHGSRPALVRGLRSAGYRGALPAVDATLHARLTRLAMLLLSE